MSYRWNGGKGPYSPAFFYGVTWRGEYDNDGYKIYRFENPFENNTGASHHLTNNAVSTDLTNR
jgi:hypothetical protein